MRKIINVFLAFACLSMMQVCYGRTVTDELTLAEMKKTLDQRVIETLNAYNKGDYSAFCRFFSQTAKREMTARYFAEVYMGVYKDEFGDFLYSDLSEKLSSFDANYPRLVYDGVFVKNEHVQIIASFENENGLFRVASVRFYPVPASSRRFDEWDLMRIKKQMPK